MDSECTFSPQLSRRARQMKEREAAAGRRVHDSLYQKVRVSRLSMAVMNLLTGLFYSYCRAVCCLPPMASPRVRYLPSRTGETAGPRVAREAGTATAASGHGGVHLFAHDYEPRSQHEAPWHCRCEALRSHVGGQQAKGGVQVSVTRRQYSSCARIHARVLHTWTSLHAPCSRISLPFSYCCCDVNTNVTRACRVQRPVPRGRGESDIQSADFGHRIARSAHVQRQRRRRR